MSVHQCPKCDLRFDYRTEVDDHCWHDHPEFRHEYPAVAVPPQAPPAAVAEAGPPVARERKGIVDNLVHWVLPKDRHA